MITDSTDRPRDLDLSLFRLVCAIPYGCVGHRSIEHTIRYKAASCSGKHMLLGGLYQLAGFQVRYMMGECDLSFLNNYLPTCHSVEPGTLDFHNFIQANTRQGWVTVDATFGPREARAGLPSNMDWDGTGDCALVFPSTKIREVEDIPVAKSEALATLPATMLDKRKQALENLITYLEACYGGT